MQVKEKHLSAAEFVSVDSLNPWEKNPRKNEAAIPVVARSLETFGFGRPLVAWGREGVRRVVVGHTTLAAYHQLRTKHGPDWTPAGCPAPGWIPVRWRDDWTEAEAAGYAIADNKIGEISEWDTEALADILAGLEGEIDLAALGFQEGELAAFLPEEADEFRPAADETHLLSSRFEVLVTCTSEHQQGELLMRLSQEGYECRSLIS